jgi:dTDP-glucose pyrophosphorylase
MHPESSLREVLDRINSESSQFVLVLDHAESLMGVVTDGDIRRALLRGEGLETPVSMVMNTSPKLAFEGEPRVVLLRRMQEHDIHFLVKVDASKKVLGIIRFADIAVPPRRSNPVVIMAGGRGRRLGHLTATCPKPMLPVGKKPILELILENLATHGFATFHISVNYLSEKITQYFGDGSHMGVRISYIHEKMPLGTAGSLGLMDPKPQKPCLVMNGDIFTDLDFGKFLDWHEASGNDATVCLREITYEIPFGVVERNPEGLIQSIREKPTFTYLANAGIYVLNPELFSLVPPNREYPMTKLLEDALARGKKLGSYVVEGLWIDVGRSDDFQRACQIFCDDDDKKG